MEKFRVYMTCTAVHFVDLEAESDKAAEEQALEMAGRSDSVRLSSENDWSLMQVEKR